MLEELQVQSTVEEMQIYRKNWKEHVEKMQDERLENWHLNTNQWEKEIEGVL
jgi:hypothetical protein